MWNIFFIAVGCVILGHILLYISLTILDKFNVNSDYVAFGLLLFLQVIPIIFMQIALIWNIFYWLGSLIYNYITGA